MNIADTMRANGLIEQRAELLSKLKLLGKAAGFPIASLTYLTNAGISIPVSISKEIQPAIETLLETTIRGQVAQLDRQLTALGVTIEEDANENL